MARKKQDKIPPKKYTFRRFVIDLGTAAVAAGVAGIVWTGDRISDCIN